MTIGLGGIILCGVVIAVFVIGAKVREQGAKLKELEDDYGKK